MIGKYKLILIKVLIPLNHNNSYILPTLFIKLILLNQKEYEQENINKKLLINILYNCQII